MATGYWLLLRCARLYPFLPTYGKITAIFDEHFTPALMQQETAYFQTANRASFERPYGFGWILGLAQELTASTHPRAFTWRTAMQTLTMEIRRRLLDYLG
ncbi:MAG TPA: DUF2891 family protein, partial [Herbaspirillum sp.]|nr:DUF2891 family protein [Herbaspirillum sp.]